MSFAQGSRSRLVAINEVTFGTTPATPTMVVLPYASHSLDMTKTILETADIRSDRMIPSIIHGNRTVSGDVTVDFRPGDYDNLLEGALFGAITSGVLKCGTTQKFFSIEDQMLDIAQYRLMKGMMVKSLEMTVKPNAITQAKFTFLGKDMVTSNTSGASSVTSDSGNAPFNSFGGTINEGGSPIASVNSIQFTIDNGLKETQVIGSAVTPQMEYGKSKITGTVMAYFADQTLFNKFVNETSSTLQFSLADTHTGHTYTFLFPNIKYTGGNLPVANEQCRVLSLPFEAVLDAVTENTNLKLTIS